MRTITFYTHSCKAFNVKVCSTLAGTLWTMRKSKENIHTTQLSLISFDLLEQFDMMYLNINGEVYELRLGANTWTDKELRIAHNLLKIVTAQFLVHLQHVNYETYY